MLDTVQSWTVLKYSKNCFKILDFTRIVLDVMMLDPV
jgi:hypothetical protein